MEGSKPVTKTRPVSAHLEKKATGAGIQETESGMVLTRSKELRSQAVVKAALAHECVC